MHLILNWEDESENQELRIVIIRCSRFTIHPFTIHYTTYPTHLTQFTSFRLVKSRSFCFIYAVISLKNVTKRYPNGVTALDDVSIAIGKGEICGYIGTNGAGKSTTVKILSGIIDLDKGEAEVSGLSLKKNSQDVKRITGYVPETANLFNSLSPFEFFRFISRIREIDDTMADKRAENFAELFDFKEMLNESIGNLSKGNKQKVLITSALLHNPDVLLLDEPLNGLDADSIFVFQDLLKFLASKGKSILYCSHLLSAVEKVATDIVLLNAGRIVFGKKTDELKNSKEYSGLENLFKELRPNSKIRTGNYEGLFD